MKKTYKTPAVSIWTIEPVLMTIGSGHLQMTTNRTDETEIRNGGDILSRENDMWDSSTAWDEEE